MSEEIFVGKINLNDEKAPFIEIILDTAEGRSEGEIVLLKQIKKEDRRYYADKIEQRWLVLPKNKRGK